jgi:CheY-like chemotaxis protein
MGLAGSYGIVQRHGGEISVASEPGNGTSFTIRLPLSVEQPEPDERPMHRPVSFRLNILVVDDMLAVVKHLHTGLTSYGQTVHSASSGPAALDIFRETPVDVVICDLAMPEMNGWQVGEELMNICAERGMDKPVFIMLTGWGGQIAEEEKIRRSGVDRILEKPLDIDELVHVIEELIGERTASGG